MKISQSEGGSILRALLSARKKREVELVLNKLESTGAVVWRLLGDNANNYPTVHLTANADVSLVERITNAIDATFERIAEQRPELKAIRSPREFSEKAIGFKDGILAETVKRRKRDAADDYGVSAELWSGDDSSTPTIEIIDNGVGLTRDEIPETILSLHESNKIKKWYLMGRFGQGGSTTFQFCEYTVIVSKKFNGDHVSFTVIKYQPRQQDERHGKYVYLVDKADNKPLFVPKANKSIEFEHSTLVRHIDYRIGKQNLLTLYGKLEYRLFDPVLPFRLVDNNAETGKEHYRRLYGSRDRLNRTDLVELKREFQKESEYGTLTLRYWLFKDDTDVQQKLTFIEPEEPIVVTFNGQSHSVMPRRVLHECRLPYLEDDFVVQIDCDQLNERGVGTFFPSTRETLSSEGLSIIKKLIVSVISDSTELRQINTKREEMFLTREFSEEKEKMRKSLAEMINRILPGKLRISGGNKGEGEKKPPAPTGLTSTEIEEPEKPVSLQDYPTFIKIINKADPIIFRPNQTTKIELLSDAPNNFLSKNKATLTLSGEAEKFVGRSYQQKDFRDGRMTIAIGVKEGILPKTVFRFGLRLVANKPTGEKEIFESFRDAIVEEPILRKENADNVETDAPWIVEVNQNHAYYTTNRWNEENVAKVEKSVDKTTIYVSVVNKWYLGAMLNSKYTEGKKTTLRSRYVLLTAFYAYLQDDRYDKLATDEEKRHYEKVSSSQLEIAARTVLTAITSEKAFKEMD